MGWLVLAQVWGGSARCLAARHSDVLVQLKRFQKRALVSLHATTLLRDMSARSEVAFVFISAPHFALV